ncbi:unnamed protein product [Soboliphyme baturini]|uniref:Membrane bound O-acyltransferase domain containing 5 n=1 Tax=Soboliphyme baturini TaxID=241478 RepID=A0A183J8I8_9BILA|nr:unnamed protein product [Soboliphyme baturini]
MNFYWRFIYIVFCLFLIRTRYYYAWLMADAISNASGFGFSGKCEGGKPLAEPNWDYLSNVHVIKFETANSWKECLEAWNCNTMQWLRQIMYVRLPVRYRTFLTYVVSAWWHGFFPGYYVTFFTGALVTIAARNVRQLLLLCFI